MTFFLLLRIRERERENKGSQIPKKSKEKIDNLLHPRNSKSMSIYMCVVQAVV